MPRCQVDDAEISYESYGDTGPNLLLSSGGFSTKETCRLLAKKLSKKHRVAIYDRPLSGETDIVVQHESLFAMWAENLIGLIEALDLVPTYLLGGSGGNAALLIAASRYPNYISGLIINAPATDDIEFWNSIAKDGYSLSATIAESEGMKGVLKSTSTNWLAQWSMLLENNPRNRQILESIDPAAFASTMKSWVSALVDGNAHRGHMSDIELSAIKVPCLIVSGEDPYHPQHVAAALHSALPNSRMHTIDELFSGSDLLRFREFEKNWGDGKSEAMFAQIIEEFISSSEKSYA